VLKHMSLVVAEGECVAIVGRSGSGKTTMTALLHRLYEPSSGTITIGSNNIQTTDITYLRENISIVSQSPHLFEGTLAENIAYGGKRLSHKDLQRAAMAANIHDFIMSLPQAYDTMVGECASLISGGEAQRLQIARTLARPSKVLILDECTSALDPSNEAAVLDTIRRVKVGRTTIVVTHKLQLMRMCDRIVLIDDGKVAEHGTYDDLVKKNGIFARLARAGEWVGE
jgi:ATP-binding cassette, subfamily B (MDR/TAP), member 1